VALALAACSGDEAWGPLRDLLAPDVVQASVRLTLEPDPSRGVGSVLAVGAGTTARVSFDVLDALASPPELVTEPALPFVAESGSAPTFRFAFRPGKEPLPQGLVRLSVRLRGANGTEALRPLVTTPPLVIDTTPPAAAPVDVPGAVVLRVQASGATKRRSVAAAAAMVEPGSRLVLFDGPDPRTARRLATSAPSDAEAGVPAEIELDPAAAARTLWVALIDGAGNDAVAAGAVPVAVIDRESPLTAAAGAAAAAVRTGRWEARRDQDPACASAVPAAELAALDDDDGRGVEASAEWSWRELPVEVPAPGVGSWRGVSDPVRGLLLLFGGGTTAAPAAELWSWDGSSWRRAPAAPAPPPRTDAALAFDPSEGRLVLFGGRAADGALLDDCWTWDGTAWSERAAAARPPPRADASLAWDPERGLLTLFGGDGASGLLDDTWTFNGGGWQQRSAASRPPPRAGAAMAAAPGGPLVLFGGRAASGAVADLWARTADGWRALPAAGAAPPARAHATLLPEPETSTLLLLGGDGAPGSWRWRDGAWALEAEVPAVGSPSLLATLPGELAPTLLTGCAGAAPCATALLRRGSGGWSRVNPGVGAPRAGYAANLTYLPTTRQFVLLGALGDTRMDEARDPETWIFEGGRWRRFEGSSPRVILAPLSYVPTLRALYLYGGRTLPREALDRAWTFDGSAWTLLPADESMTPRYDHAQAWDSRRNALIIFGGYDSGRRNDTWAFLDMAWRPVEAAHPPEIVRAHRMVYDPARDRTVLFGGSGVEARIQTTHVFDGSDWALVDTPTAPYARNAHALAWDEARNGVVLFGGETLDVTSPPDDLWEWTGAAWIDRTPTGRRPSSRILHGMAFDPERRRFLVAGGMTLPDGAPLSDTWELDTTSLPAVVVELAPPAGPVEPARMAALAIEARAGALSYRVAPRQGATPTPGAELLLWSPDEGRWRSLARNHAPADAPGRLVGWLPGDAARALLARGRGLFVAIRPAYEAGAGAETPRVVVDSISMRASERPDVTRAWTFATDGDREGWSAEDLGARAPADGVWRLASTGAAGYLRGPVRPVAAEAVRVLRLRVRGAQAPARATLSWSAAEGAGSLDFDWPDGATTTEVRLDLRADPAWRGSIERLELTLPPGASGREWALDAIELLP